MNRTLELFAIALATSTFLGVNLGAASAQSVTMVQVPKGVNLADKATMVQAPKLFSFDEIGLVDQGTAKDYVIYPSGPVSLQDPLRLGFLTRGPAPFTRVRIEIMPVAGNQPAAAIGCGQTKGILVGGTFTLETRGPDSYITNAAAKQAKAGVIPAGSAPLRLAFIRANFSAALASQVPANGQFLLVRAFPVNAAGQCYGTSAGGFIAKFEPFTPVKVVVATAPPPAPVNGGLPYVSSSVRVVGYAPEIKTVNCRYIIRGPISDPTYKAILENKNIPTTIGTKVNLCMSELEYAYQQLPALTRAKLTLQSILQWSASKFNWTAEKFQSLAASLASPLAPIVGPKLSQMIGNAFLLHLPRAPLTGDFNMLADQGCGFVKQQIGDEMTDNGSSEENKQKAENQLDVFCNKLKKAAAEAGAPNDYLLIDHEFDPRSATLYLQATYTGQNGALPTTRGGDRKIALEIRSKGGPGPNAVGLNFPQILLYQRDFNLPNGKPGDSIVFPVPLDPSATYGSMDWTIGYNAYAGARASAGGSPSMDLQIMPGKAVAPPK